MLPKILLDITINNFTENPLRAAFQPYIEVLGSMFFVVLMLGYLAIIYTASEFEHKFLLLLAGLTIIGSTGIILLPVIGKVFLGIIYAIAVGWLFYLIFGTKQRNF